MSSTSVQREPLVSSPSTVHASSQTDPVGFPTPRTPDFNIHESSFVLEADSSATLPTNWTFDGSLVPTLHSMNIVPGRPIKYFETAKRRREVRTDPQLSIRRNDLLCIAERSMNRSKAPGSRMMTCIADGHSKMK